MTAEAPPSAAENPPQPLEELHRPPSVLGEPEEPSDEALAASLAFEATFPPGLAAATRHGRAHTPEPDAPPPISEAELTRLNLEPQPSPIQRDMLCELGTQFGLADIAGLIDTAIRDGWLPSLDPVQLSAKETQDTGERLVNQWLYFVAIEREQDPQVEFTYRHIERFWIQQATQNDRAHRTRNKFCAFQECTLECCPLEYAHATLTTYMAHLNASPRLHEFHTLFRCKQWKAYLRRYGKRQQANNRFSLPAPPLFVDEAIEIFSEAKRWLSQLRASPTPDLYRILTITQAFTALAIDLAHGRRTGDLLKTQFANLHVFLDADTKELREVRIGFVDSKCTLPPDSIYFRRLEGDVAYCPVQWFEEYARTAADYGVPLDNIRNGLDCIWCSPYLFPRYYRDNNQLPVLSPLLAGNPRAHSWETATTSDCNRILKSLLTTRLAGAIDTKFTFHSSRGAVALVSRANNMDTVLVNENQGWAKGSTQNETYARLVQLQAMTTPQLQPQSVARTIQQQWEQFTPSLHIAKLGLNHEL